MIPRYASDLLERLDSLAYISLIGKANHLR